MHGQGLRMGRLRVEMELLETFDSLGADDEQMEYVTVYASGKAGWATTDMDVARELAQGGMEFKKEYSMEVLLNSILENIPPPIIASTTEESNSDDDNGDEATFALAATRYRNIIRCARLHEGWRYVIFENKKCDETIGYTTHYTTYIIYGNWG